MNEMDAASAGRSDAPLTYGDLIDRITAWGMDTPDVRATFILGSRARTDHPADEWSDLDVVVFARRHEQFLETDSWLATIAPYWLTFLERAGNGEAWERRTLYEGGLDVDIVFNPPELLDGLMHNIPQDVADMMRRGVKILVDKDGKLEQIRQKPLPETSLFRKPGEREFVNATSDFWYHTLWGIRHLRRGELWWAKGCVDDHLKGLLRQMLEWHTHACRGGQFDTWMRGRFLEEWADPRAVEQLASAFAHYDRHDVARALHVTMDLYRWLQDETAACWGYACPTEGEHRAAALTLKLIEEMN